MVQRGIDDVEQDPMTMGMREWRTRARNRQEWRKLTREAKVHSGLYRL
jgi:hypothetical protein